MDECMIATMTAWEFPALPNAVWLTWPFEFKPAYTDFKE
jgi:hypothetical protein